MTKVMSVDATATALRALGARVVAHHRGRRALKQALTRMDAVPALGEHTEKVRQEFRKNAQVLQPGDQHSRHI